MSICERCCPFGDNAPQGNQVAPLRAPTQSQMPVQADARTPLVSQEIDTSQPSTAQGLATNIPRSSLPKVESKPQALNNRTPHDSQQALVAAINSGDVQTLETAISDAKGYAGPELQTARLSLGQVKEMSKVKDVLIKAVASTDVGQIQAALNQARRVELTTGPEWENAQQAIQARLVMELTKATDLRSVEALEVAIGEAQEHGIQSPELQNAKVALREATAQAEQAAKADNTEKHEFLNIAKRYDWDELRMKLRDRPEFINVQPAGRWSALHQAAEHGNEQMVKDLLDAHADVTLVTNDGKTALQIAKDSVRHLLEERLPKPACPHVLRGLDCCIRSQEHVGKYSHPDRRSGMETDKFGKGQWELNMHGDALSQVGWSKLIWADADTAVPSGQMTDEAYHKFLNGGASRVMFLHGFKDNAQEVRVDFQLMVMYRKEVKRNAGKSEEAAKPLRRLRMVDGTEKKVQFPEGQHPWLCETVRQKELQSKGVGNFLTNEFFWEAFTQAVSQNGGEVDFSQDSFFNFAFNEDWTRLSLDDAELERRGGVLYRAPAGWKRFALNLDKYGNDKTWMGMKGQDGEWAVAYHGTSMNIVPQIVKEGFRVGKGQGAKNCLDVRSYGLGENERKCGPGIFCTPNIKTVECYANGGEDAGSENKEAAATVRGRTLFFALQCRINPKAIKRPQRHFALNNDEEVMGLDGVFEWIINDPKDIRPYAILVRDKEGSDHRTLRNLIMPIGKWNQDHRPLPFGSFDHVPGKIKDKDAMQGMQQAYLHANEKITNKK